MPARHKPWLSDELVAYLTGTYERWLFEPCKPNRRVRFRLARRRFRVRAYDWAGIKEAAIVPMTWRFWLVRFTFTPGMTVRYLISRFKVHTVLPGDKFEDFQRDERYEVTEVRADYVHALIIVHVRNYIAPEITGYTLPMVDVVKAWRPGRRPSYDLFLEGAHERDMTRWIPYKGEL